MRMYTSILTGLFLLAACAPATEQTEKTISEAPAGPPPLEITLITEDTLQRDKLHNYKHTAAFGYWHAECTAAKNASDPVEGWCDVYPTTGGNKGGKNIMIPYADRATVSFYKREPAKIVLRTAKRASGSQLSYKCGTAHWSGPEGSNKLKFFYKQDAQKFLTQMRRTDCSLTYTPSAESLETSVSLPSHGFKEAFDYAKKYVRMPKGL